MDREMGRESVLFTWGNRLIEQGFVRMLVGVGILVIYLSFCLSGGNCVVSDSLCFSVD
jgi:hypothetical protein